MNILEGLKNAGEDSGNSIIGNIEKAIIIIPNMELSKNKSSSISQITSNVLTGSGVSSMATKLGKGFHVMEVQYNPSTISFQSNAQALQYRSLQKNMDEGIPKSKTRNPSVTLSVQLIFDDVNNMDAFMSEKTNVASVGGVVSATTGILKQKQGGYSVAPQTNAFIAAALRSKTRELTFKWSDTSFTGVITEISAKYTMFSVSGKPIRSIVNMTLTQEVKKSSDMNYWNNAFDKAFGKEDMANTTGDRGISSKMGNILNL